MDDAAGLAKKLGRGQAQPFGGQRDAVEDSIGLVARGGRRLGDDGPAIGAGHDDVGEGAPDINADRVCHEPEISRAGRRGNGGGSGGEIPALSKRIRLR